MNGRDLSMPEISDPGVKSGRSRSMSLPSIKTPVEPGRERAFSLPLAPEMSGGAEARIVVPDMPSLDDEGQSDSAPRTRSLSMTPLRGDAPPPDMRERSKSLPPLRGNPVPDDHRDVPVTLEPLRDSGILSEPSGVDADLPQGSPPDQDTGGDSSSSDSDSEELAPLPRRRANSAIVAKTKTVEEVVGRRRAMSAVTSAERDKVKGSKKAAAKPMKLREILEARNELKKKQRHALLKSKIPRVMKARAGLQKVQSGLVQRGMRSLLRFDKTEEAGNERVQRQGLQVKSKDEWWDMKETDKSPLERLFDGDDPERAARQQAAVNDKLILKPAKALSSVQSGIESGTRSLFSRFLSEENLNAKVDKLGIEVMDKHKWVLMDKAAKSPMQRLYDAKDPARAARQEAFLRTYMPHIALASKVQGGIESAAKSVIGKFTKNSGDKASKRPGSRGNNQK